MTDTVRVKYGADFHSYDETSPCIYLTCATVAKTLEHLKAEGVKSNYLQEIQAYIWEKQASATVDGYDPDALRFGVDISGDDYGIDYEITCTISKPLTEAQKAAKANKLQKAKEKKALLRAKAEQVDRDEYERLKVKYGV